MKRKNTFIYLGTIVLAGLFLAACNGAPQEVDLDPNVDTAPLQQEVEVSDPVGISEASEGEDPPAVLPPESPPAGVKPTPRPELSATKPSTVSLASGRPQLVEFFAFW